MKPYLHAHTAGDEVKRFGLYRVLEHWGLVLLFLLLAVTGFARAFDDHETARAIVELSGGHGTLRRIHICAGALYSLFIIVHVAVAFYGVRYRGWPLAMLVTLRDPTCLTSDIRYYLGLAEEPARCGRYGYKEKFIYWATLLFSVALMLSGVVLCFPGLFVHLLPPETIPAAATGHGGVALLIGLLALWHIYDAVFSPESFPLETSIFTGRISLEKMERRHPEERADISFPAPPRKDE